MNIGTHIEICVVGGGPAGSTVARKLAMLGHQVALFEAAAFPRRHIGESLPAGILPVLDALGLRQTIEQGGFLRSRDALLHWSSQAREKSQPGEPGFQVDRGRFDQLLLNAARAEGVQVYQPARLVDASETDGLWQLKVMVGQTQVALSADFIVDATGKGGFLKTGYQRYSEPTLALFAYWKNVQSGGTETRIEAAEDAWYWGAPLPDGLFNACVFVDSRSIEKGQSITDAYLARLAKSELLKHCLQGDRESEVSACNAAAYFSRAPIGARYIQVGDAAWSIDPLSSQGVQKAMAGALQGAIAVHTLRTATEHSEAAIGFYQTRQQESVEQNQRWTARFYGEQSIHSRGPFWQRRSCLPVGSTAEQTPITHSAPLNRKTLLEFSADVAMVQTPGIQGDIICMHNALHHPALERPVSYLGGVALVPLLAQLQPGESAGQLLAKWCRSVPEEKAAELIEWLWMRGVLVDGG